MHLIDNGHDGPVYDIEVETDHSFALACGLIAHNCPLCHRLAEASKANPVPLGGEFANIGDNPTYSSIKMPPGHPRCRCSVTYRLSPEYQAVVDANPPETFAPGAMGPEG